MSIPFLYAIAFLRSAGDAPEVPLVITPYRGYKSTYAANRFCHASKIAVGPSRLELCDVLSRIVLWLKTLKRSMSPVMQFAPAFNNLARNHTRIYSHETIQEFPSFCVEIDP